MNLKALPLPLPHGIEKCPMVAHLRISEQVVDHPRSCFMPTAYLDILLLLHIKYGRMHIWMQVEMSDISLLEHSNQL